MGLKTNFFTFNSCFAALAGCGDFHIAPMQLKDAIHACTG